MFDSKYLEWGKLKFQLKDYVFYYKEATKHKLWVFYYILKLCWKLTWRGLFHDWPKYYGVEADFAIPVMHKLRAIEYGSKEYCQ